MFIFKWLKEDLWTIVSSHLVTISLVRGWPFFWHSKYGEVGLSCWNSSRAFTGQVVLSVVAKILIFAALLECLKLFRLMVRSLGLPVGNE